MEHQREATDFDRVVKELQRQIIEQERALYSARVIEEAHNPTQMMPIYEYRCRDCDAAFEVMA